MPDPVEPRLPDTAPIELREFVACKRSRVTVQSGPLNWLPLPPELADLPAPDLTIAPGTTPGTATLTIGFGIFSVSLPATVSNGQLTVDTSGLGDMLSGAVQPITDWVKQLNEWLRHNGQQLGAPSVTDGAATLVKEALPAAAGTGVVPAPVPVPAPSPTVSPSTAPPPPAQTDNTGCLKWIGLGVLLLIGAGLGYIALDQLNVIGGPAATVSSTPSPVAVLPTQPDVPDPNMPPDEDPTPSAGRTQPDVPDPNMPPEEDPTSSPTATPTAGRTQPDVPDPNMPPTEGEFTTEMAVTRLEAFFGDSIRPPAGWEIGVDDPGDTFTFDTGFPPPIQPQAAVDILGGGGFLFEMTRATAQDMTDLYTCPPANVITFMVFCNQDMPLVPGTYTVGYAAFAAPRPDPFPAQGICSWGFQWNLDGDVGTGFPNPPPGHPLIGAEMYDEGLIFQGQSGELDWYLLRTDYREPVRPDTNDYQGNVPTRARLIGSDEVELPTYSQGFVDFVLLAPTETTQLVPEFGVHAYCATDRGNMFETLTVDALGHPNDTPYPVWRDLLLAE